MSNIVNATYEKLPVGGTGVVRPTDGQSDEEFQVDVKIARDMESQGLIEISNPHRESQSGNGYVDAFMIKRLA